MDPKLDVNDVRVHAKPNTRSRKAESKLAERGELRHLHPVSAVPDAGLRWLVRVPDFEKRESSFSARSGGHQEDIAKKGRLCRCGIRRIGVAIRGRLVGFIDV